MVLQQKDVYAAYLNMKVQLTCVVHHTNKASFRWRSGGDREDTFSCLRTVDMEAGDST